MTNNITNNRWIRLVKDVLFACIGLWAISKKAFLLVLLGAIGFIWYGRDAWYQIKALWQEKHFVPKTETPRPADNGKISLSSDAKEVEFEKE